MNGFIRRTAVLVSLAGGLASAGCWQEAYYRCVDPCYPARYEVMAEQEVLEPLTAQVNNGHVLDQTIWNYHFEAGTDKLTPGGQYKLTILARRRPHPDSRIFLQTAQDIEYNPAAPDALATRRADLDARRVQAVLKYLQAQTAARPMPWDVTVHDPGEVGLGAVPMQASMTIRDGNFRGVLMGTAGAGGAAGTATTGIGMGTTTTGTMGRTGY
jgi:hypothetical protein